MTTPNFVLQSTRGGKAGQGPQLASSSARQKFWSRMAAID
jgi:hypothetical protein